jgi:hypothetical protein
MEQNADIERLIEILHKEHRSTQLVFGLSIIILALILMVIAPEVIRTRMQDTYVDDMQGMPVTDTEHHAMENVAPATTTPVSATSSASQ